MNKQEGVQYLVLRKFSFRKPWPANGWKHDALYLYPDGRMMNPDDTRAVQEIEAYKADLQTKSPEEIEVLCVEERTQKEREDDEVYLFDSPDTDANFSHWAKLPCWSLEEASILVGNGRDPSFVTLERLKPYKYDEHDSILRAFEIHDLAIRAMRMNQLCDPIEPSAFLAWVKKNGFDVNAQLDEAISASAKLAIRSAAVSIEVPKQEDKDIAEWIYQRHLSNDGKYENKTAIYDAACNKTSGLKFIEKDFNAAYQAVFITKRGKRPTQGWSLQPQYELRYQQDRTEKAS